MSSGGRETLDDIRREILSWSMGGGYDGPSGDPSDLEYMIERAQRLMDQKKADPTLDNDRQAFGYSFLSIIADDNSTEGKFSLDFKDAVSQRTPLLCAAFKGCDMRVYTLLEYGVNTEARDSNGHTALLLACKYGETRIVRYLLEHGADTEASTRSGKTALIQAFQKGDHGAVEVLLKHGADTEATRKDGMSCVDIHRKYREPGFTTPLYMLDEEDEEYGFPDSDELYSCEDPSFVEELINTRSVRLINTYRRPRANWSALAPLLTCLRMHASSQTSSQTSSQSRFAMTIEALLPNIRRYAGYEDEDVPSPYECGSAACVSFLSSSYAQAITASTSGAHTENDRDIDGAADNTSCSSLTYSEARKRKCCEL